MSVGSTMMLPGCVCLQNGERKIMARPVNPSNVSELREGGRERGKYWVLANTNRGLDTPTGVRKTIKNQMCEGTVTSGNADVRARSTSSATAVQTHQGWILVGVSIVGSTAVHYCCRCGISPFVTMHCARGNGGYVFAEAAKNGRFLTKRRQKTNT